MTNEEKDTILETEEQEEVTEITAEEETNDVTAEEEIIESPSEESPAEEEALQDSISDEKPAEEEEIQYIFSEEESNEEAICDEPEQKKCVGKKILKVLIPIVSAILIVVLTIILIPRVKFLWAKHLIKNGEYENAYKILKGIDESYAPAEKELKKFIMIFDTEEIYYGEELQQKKELRYEFNKGNYTKTTITDGFENGSEQNFYDSNGFIIKSVITEGGQEITITYTNDKKGRPIKAVQNNGYMELTSEIEYDKYGNVVKITQTTGSNGAEETMSKESKNFSIQYLK